MVLIRFRRVKGHLESGQIVQEKQSDDSICLKSVSFSLLLKDSNQVVKFTVYCAYLRTRPFSIEVMMAIRQVTT